MIKQRKQIQLRGDPCNVIWYGVHNYLIWNMQSFDIVVVMIRCQASLLSKLEMGIL